MGTLKKHNHETITTATTTHTICKRVASDPDDLPVATFRPIVNHEAVSNGDCNMPLLLAEVGYTSVTNTSKTPAKCYNMIGAPIAITHKYLVSRIGQSHPLSTLTSRETCRRNLVHYFKQTIASQPWKMEYRPYATEMKTLSNDRLADILTSSTKHWPGHWKVQGRNALPWFLHRRSGTPIDASAFHQEWMSELRSEPLLKIAEHVVQSRINRDVHLMPGIERSFFVLRGRRDEYMPLEQRFAYKFLHNDPQNHFVYGVFCLTPCCIDVYPPCENTETTRSWAVETVEVGTGGTFVMFHCVGIVNLFQIRVRPALDTVVACGTFFSFVPKHNTFRNEMLRKKIVYSLRNDDVESDEHAAALNGIHTEQAYNEYVFEKKVLPPFCSGDLFTYRNTVIPLALRRRPRFFESHILPKFDFESGIECYYHIAPPASTTLKPYAVINDSI